MREALLAALFVLAPSARAELAQFDAGPNKADAVFSDDGYHFAYFESDGQEDRWIVDGRPRVRLPAGSLQAGTGALSADGRVLVHLLNVFDKSGTQIGVAAAVNGKPAGAAYPEIQELSISPRGGNAAYDAHFPNGWAVVSGQGVGPVFADPPVILGLTERGVLYLGSAGGATWLYRNHKAVGRADLAQASASADLRRYGGVLKADDGTVFVEVDGKRAGPYASATVPVFSPNGLHEAFLAETLPSAGVGYDALYVDGRPAPLHRCRGCGLQVDDAGRVFEDQLLIAVDERSEMHRFFLDGKELGRPPRVGFAAGGRHYVYPQLSGGGGSVGLDGRVTERGAPIPIPSSSIPIAFDGADEYHYWTVWGSNIRLVCGTVDGSNPLETRCAKLGAALYQPVPKDQ